MRRGVGCVARMILHVGFVQRAEILHQDSQEVTDFDPVFVIHEDGGISIMIGNKDLG